MPSTIKDVAAHAEVAVSTASYVLNNKPKAISSATRERVWTAARELGYRPNPAARSLVTKRTRMVALWIMDMASAFSARVIAEIQAQARQHGYEMLVSEIHDESFSVPSLPGTETPQRNVRQSLWHVDGVITYLGLSNHHVALDSRPLRQVPLVTLGSFPLEGADFVGVELSAGAQEAVRRLQGAGCRRIAYVVPDKVNLPGDARREAYFTAIQETGLTPRVIVVPQNPTMEMRAAARLAVREDVRRQEAPDGLFCFNDECAIGAYRGLRDAGLRVPEDVSIIGCNGIEDTKYLDSPLSTLVLPVQEMCRAAWQFLEQRIEAPDTAPQQVIMAPHLEIRESLRSPKSQT